MGCGTRGGCSTYKVSEKRGSAASSVFNWLANIEDAKKNLIFNKDNIIVYAIIFIG